MKIEKNMNIYKSRKEQIEIIENKKQLQKAHEKIHSEN
jgi:hypothetical protein